MRRTSRAAGRWLKTHSGLLVLDFDDCGTEKKTALGDDPHTVLCFVSPSGRGLKLVVRIDADGATHAESFDAARVYFRDKYGLVADRTGRALARLCFASFDPEAILKDGAKAQVLYRPHMTTHDNTSNALNGLNGLYNTPGRLTVEEAIMVTLPTRKGQRHRKVFNLTQALKFDCGLADKSLSELKPYVHEWYEKALPVIGTPNFDETWSDFIHAWPRVKKPLSSNSLLEAWTKAQNTDLPPEAYGYDSKEVQMLLALCFHLSQPTGTFFLAMGQAGALLELKPMQVMRLLKMLTIDGRLTLVKPGDRKHANTYQWHSATPTG